MKQKYAVIVFMVLIAASGLTSLSSYRATERLVEDDMSQALALALDEQQSDVISADTIRVFNSHLQLSQLRGHAMLAVDTRQKGFRCEAKCSGAATSISALDDSDALGGILLLSSQADHTDADGCTAIWRLELCRV